MSMVRVFSGSYAPYQWACHWRKKSLPPQQALTAHRSSGRGGLIHGGMLKPRCFVSVGDCSYYEFMSCCCALSRRQHFLALFLASDLRSVASSRMIPKLWARRQYRCLIRAGHLAFIYFQHGEVFWRTVLWSFSSHWNASPCLPLYSLCSPQRDWVSVPLCRPSSSFLSGWRAPFLSPPHSPSDC